MELIFIDKTGGPILISHRGSGVYPDRILIVHRKKKNPTKFDFWT